MTFNLFHKNAGKPGYNYVPICELPPAARKICNDAYEPGRKLTQDFAFGRREGAEIVAGTVVKVGCGKKRKRPELADGEECFMHKRRVLELFPDFELMHRCSGTHCGNIVKPLNHFPKHSSICYKCRNNNHDDKHAALASADSTRKQCTHCRMSKVIGEEIDRDRTQCHKCRGIGKRAPQTVAKALTVLFFVPTRSNPDSPGTSVFESTFEEVTGIVELDCPNLFPNCTLRAKASLSYVPLEIFEHNVQPLLLKACKVDSDKVEGWLQSERIVFKRAQSTVTQTTTASECDNDVANDAVDSEDAAAEDAVDSDDADDDVAEDVDGADDFENLEDVNNTGDAHGNRSTLDSDDKMGFVHKRIVEKIVPTFRFAKRCKGSHCNESVKVYCKFSPQKNVCIHCKNFRRGDLHRAKADADSSLRYCKHCSTARDKDVMFDGTNTVCKVCNIRGRRNDSKPERREQKRALSRLLQTWKAHRQRRMAADPVGYRAHLAKVHKDWYYRNQDHVAYYCKNHAGTRLSILKSSADKRDIQVSLDDSVLLEMFEQPCFYCGATAEETQRLSGIDRLISTRGYVEGNCVSCCKLCNMSKGLLDPVTFIQRASHLARVHTGSDEYFLFVAAFRDDYEQSKLSKYKLRSKEKNFPDCDLDDCFDELTRNTSCFYCDRAVACGIDRIDSSVGYVADNMVSCCGHCNYMKWDIELDTFFALMCAISLKFKDELQTNSWELFPPERIFRRL